MENPFTPLEKNFTVKRFRSLTGFTLIELIVVIAIVAVLAAIIAPNAFRAIEKAKISKTVSDFKTVKLAALAYRVDTGQWPYEGAVHRNRSYGLGFISNDGSSNWDGPYLDNWPVSQWSASNTTFKYVYYDDILEGDWDGDGDPVSHFISLSEDNVGSQEIPMRVMKRIDEILDDGNLSSGKIQFWQSNWFDYLVVR
ncbi:MAG: prepilin-type N-terminal cleavage/methylation domain-containing protein [Candidatus Omnitrophica bacterium]|nr:prepilin-type N-terminal cleavage/methylation domain-containing protein [Candidatus Omnitrophota bacterium]MDD5430205.1 prepilin-type N-terminal cleavage/methylation domain-containing protein [Candidatus Omnitrophota bacterium]